MGNINNKVDAEKIIDICNNKQYNTLSAGKPITVKLKDIIPAEFKSSEYLDTLKFEPKVAGVSRIITDHSAVDDIIKVSRDNPDYKVGVLNFASSYHPGGGFITGAMAQEEALCHASTLYLQLNSCNELYNKNRASRLDVYTDNMAVCNTEFFRNSSGIMIPKPVTATVITSAAVNNNKLSDRNSDRVKEIMKIRMKKIIMLAIEEHIDIFILGAFGCGVFGNDPYFIADTWKTLTDSYGGYFKKIYFSILKNKSHENFRAFSTVFGDIK